MNRILEVKGGKNAAHQAAEALRVFDGLDAVARFRAELGGWHVYIRGGNG